MSTAFRLKTQPEILLRMMSNARAVMEDDGVPLDLSPGSPWRTYFEVNSESDADAYIQMAKILNLFSIFKAKGDDLDERMRDLGSDIFPEMRRLAANSSIAQIVVGDGTLIKRATFDADIVVGALSFQLVAGQGALFAASGAFILEQGTTREETIIFTRSGDTITVISPSTGVVNGHPQGGDIVLSAIRAFVLTDITAGTTSIALPTGTGSAWLTSGSVVIDQGTVVEEKVAFTRSGDTLTTAATSFTHLAGASLIQSTFGSDRSVASGSIAYVPATETDKQINYRVDHADAKLRDGAFLSDLINAVSEGVGVATLVGANTITRWASSPFTGATVFNPQPSTRGRDKEKDDAYVQRVVRFLQSMSKGTPLAIVSGVSGETDPETNKQVVFAQIVEPIAPGMSLLYISDGSSAFSLSQVPFIGRDVLIADAETGDRRARLNAYGPFGYSTGPVSPRLFKSTFGGVTTLVGAGFAEDNSLTMSVNAFVGYFLKTEDNQFLQITSNTPVRFNVAGGVTPPSGSYVIFNFGGAPLTPGVDFTFNQTNGDLELSVAQAMTLHNSLVAASDGASPSVGAYTYTIGLGAFVQRLVNGDKLDFENFPGLRATGTQVLTVAATGISQQFTIQVTPNNGFTVDDLRLPIQNAVVAYVNSSDIGGEILKSEISKLVKLLPGVYDVEVLTPNVRVPDGQLMRISLIAVVVV